MTVLRAKIDTKQLNSILSNTVSYSYGFLDGTEIDQIFFNQKLGEYAVDALGYFVDSIARSNPNSLHHVYEWGQVGRKGARLFEIEAKASKRQIKFSGKFLPSKTTSPTSNTPFVDKANIMENSIEVVVSPKNSDVLAFEVDGDMVFTTESVRIANPGGDEVAGSFGNAIDTFFDSYFTVSLLKPFMKKLERPAEFSNYFPSGTRSGRSAGLTAGKKYIRSAGAIAE
jgi:hypothetical protein